MACGGAARGSRWGWNIRLRAPNFPSRVAARAVRVLPPGAARDWLLPARRTQLPLSVPSGFTSPHLTSLHCTSLHFTPRRCVAPRLCSGALTHKNNLSIARRSVAFFDHILTPLPVHLSPACSPSILQPYTPRMHSRAHLPLAGRS